MFGNSINQDADQRGKTLINARSEILRSATVLQKLVGEAVFRIFFAEKFMEAGNENLRFADHSSQRDNLSGFSFTQRPAAAKGSIPSCNQSIILDKSLFVQ